MHSLAWVVLSMCVCLGYSATKINFPGCDRAGWKCNKVQASPIRYEIEYVCQNLDGIIISLWNFNAPAEIKYLKIVNCSSFEIDLTCTGVGRQIESLYLKNIGVFNFTNLLYPDMAQMPEKVILEDVKQMPLIPERAFKQMKHPLASVYRCAVNTQPMNRIVFRNVGIGEVKQNAFYNLTEFKEFVWENVSVNEMQPLAIQIEMGKDESFIVVNSSFNQLDYKAFDIKSPEVIFNLNKFDELPKNVIQATSFQFDFINNSVKKTHSYAFILLSQNITYKNNDFNALKTSALQGIGPGLLTNALISFGQLKFTYTFINNTIHHSDIGGLNPDWLAYKNVHSSIHVTGNTLPCSCQELGWITLRSGLGNEFSSMMNFNSKFLDKANKNLCNFSPCDLPVTVMAAMNIKFGLCGVHEPLGNWCKKYRPSQKDYGFGTSAKVVLNKWENDFASNQLEETLPVYDIDQLEDAFVLAQNQPNKPLQFLQYSQGNPKESYFKIEKAGLMNIDPLNFIQTASQSNTKDLAEIAAPVTESNTLPFPVESATSSSDIVFFNDDHILNKNGTQYEMDVRNGSNSTTNVGFNTLKKEYEDNQKEFVKKTYEEWQAQRKKRMVYFKVYGNLLTLD